MNASLILASAGTAGLLTAEAKSAADPDAISATDKNKLWKAATQGPLGVIKSLRKLASKTTGVVGINLSIAALLRQSQVFTGLFGSFMQIIGAFVDITLAPFMPDIFRFFKWMADKAPAFAKLIHTLFRWAWVTIEWVINNFVNPLLAAFKMPELEWPKWSTKSALSGAMLLGNKSSQIPGIPGLDPTIDLSKKGSAGQEGSAFLGGAGGDGDGGGDTGDTGDTGGTGGTGGENIVTTVFGGGLFGALGETPPGSVGNIFKTRATTRSVTQELKNLYGGGVTDTGGGGGLFGALPSTGRLSLSGLAAPPDVAFASATWRQSEQEKFENEHRNGTTYFQAIHNTEERSFQSFLPY